MSVTLAEIDFRSDSCFLQRFRMTVCLSTIIKAVTVIWMNLLFRLWSIHYSKTFWSFSHSKNMFIHHFLIDRPKKSLFVVAMRNLLTDFSLECLHSSSLKLDLNGSSLYRKLSDNGNSLLGCPFGDTFSGMILRVCDLYITSQEVFIAGIHEQRMQQVFFHGCSWYCCEHDSRRN